MRPELTLGIAGLAGILLTLVLVTSLAPNPSGQATLNPPLHRRLCPEGMTSVYRSSPPFYPGGPAGQLNVVCVPSDRPIPQEMPTFESIPQAPFDRLSQDRVTRSFR